MIVPIQDPTPFSPFSPGEWRKALKQVAKAMYQVVELAVTDPTQLDPEEVAEALAEENLRLSSLTTGQAAGKEGLSLSTPDDDLRRRAVERIQAHVRFAARFEAVVIIGLLRGAAGNPELLVESLQECARCDPKVRLALEPLNRYESRLLNTVAEALPVVDQVGAENLGLLLDTFHANIEESGIGEAIRASGDRLFHVHLADSNRWPPGHGHLDFRAVWDALSDVGYDGSLVLECFPKPNAEAVLAAGGRVRSWWGVTR
ncbi:MAG: sugar phosphate isomerase/epimerase family protein [Candidatus Bipolaricaulota bacterium]